MSTLQASNLFLGSTGNTNIRLVNRNLAFTVGANTDVLPASVVSFYINQSGGGYPSGSIIYVFNSGSTPSGWSTYTNSSLPAGVSGYIKN